MAKKCQTCGFIFNPDNAHYCGNCGRNIDKNGNIWETYNRSAYSIITHRHLSELKRYESQAKKSPSHRLRQAAGELAASTFRFIKGPLSIWLSVIIIAAALFFFFSTLFQEDNKISRIKIEEKYGIGYSKENLLVPAVYDSISATATGNQWITFNRSIDKTKMLQGLAYVTDSIRQVIEPSFERIEWLGEGGGAILRHVTKPGSRSAFSIASKCIISPETYARWKSSPRHLWNEDNCIVVMNHNKARMIDHTGNPVDSTLYNNVSFDPEGVIRAVEYRNAKGKSLQQRVTTVHNFSGKKRIQNEYNSVDCFSDGVAWAAISQNDRNANNHYVIDMEGMKLFRKPNSRITVDFSEGIGWYATSFNPKEFIAIDKTGRELFRIKASLVYSYTMGLAPIIDLHSNKIGFVDKTGNRVIPCIYNRKSYSAPRFNSDSMMSLKLNGVEGKLHRNGSFHAGPI